MKKSQISILLILIFIVSSFAAVDGLSSTHLNKTTSDSKVLNNYENGIKDLSNSNYLKDGAGYDQNYDMGNLLSDNENNYSVKWDPWLTKAAIHAIATTDDGDMMALAGGYLYDNEVHLYRWNYETDMYDLVWEVGGGVFKSDVFALAFADTNYNNLTEIIAGTSDGTIYVFEQRHIYDPITNMENQFDLVWQSPRLGRVFALTVEDMDGDYRKDIIVGTGDMLRFYEFDKGSNYPFTEDHWMEFREVFTYEMPSQITALGVSDLNYNGLKEVAVGMRSGEIQLMENNGTTLYINGYPYPIMQDNSYKPIWSSGNMIRRSISSMSGGQMDDDGVRELLVAAQGQGAYVLDNINGIIGVYRLERPLQPWEANPKEIYPLDYWVDSMVNSSSLYNGTLLSPYGITGANVYYQNTTNKYAEPLNYTIGNYEVYPYSSYVAMQSDSFATTFDATNRPAWAVFDFGNDEEAAGNGVPNVPDLYIYIQGSSISTSNIKISVSNDNYRFYDIPTSSISYQSGKYVVEVDQTLADHSMNYYKYLRVNVTSGTLKIESIETKSLNNPIYDALSTAVGPLYLKGDLSKTNAGFIATIDGSILAVAWNETKGLYEIIWDSWAAERWKLNTNIFDLELINKASRFPAWISYGDNSVAIDFSTGTPVGSDVFTYTADNFVDYKNEKNLEFIISTMDGQFLVYQQPGPFSQPVYSPGLTSMLFDISDFSPLTVNNYLASKKAAGAKYFSASLVPMETRFANEFNQKGQELGISKYLDPINNGYWLFIGSWDGDISNEGKSQTVSNLHINDVSIWYLTQKYNDYCGDTYAERCFYFSPLLNTSAWGVFKTLTNTEASGALAGIFRESTWVPKVAAADVIGDQFSDLVLTNGKVHLLETTLAQDPEKFEPEDWTDPISPAMQTQLSTNDFYIKDQSYKYVSIYDAIDVEYSYLSYTYRGDYFSTINNDSKGRVWTNAQLVNYDGDDDFDIILGFARYNTNPFGIDKVSYGMTYFENEGTRENPIWVEKKKAVTNNDAESNLRVANFTEPVMVWNDYGISPDSLFNNPLGYHPLFKTLQPTNLYMFQTPSQYDSYVGKIMQFYADYNPPTSFLAATYPEAKRLDINLQYYSSSGGSKINYGYHIFETWNNEAQLNDWTLSMSTADLDEDGYNEVIVGDFDNNIYVFEHLNNNTYGRAYKSEDINRTILTDKSPYANEQFGGISGEFYRTMFDHVEFLIAGMDLNHNGLQEFIAATQDMIFIFEAEYTATGRVRDDTYSLIKTIDLLSLPALSEMNQDDIHVTAMTWAKDLTLDGRSELLVAVGAALLIFEIDEAPSSDIHQFLYEEIYFKNTYDLMGLYDLPGNYLLRPNIIIKALLVDDLDSDGKPDLTIAGTDTSKARPIWDGFVTIIEWEGAIFSLMFDDSQFAKTVEYNPINDLAVDDSDFDNHKELIIASEKGIDIYEFRRDNEAVLQEVITSNPAYHMPYRYYDVKTNELEHDKDVITLTNGTMLKVYIARGSTTFNLLYIYKSNNHGASWEFETLINFDGGNNFRDIQQPSLAEGYGGQIWLSFVARYHIVLGSISFDQYGIFISNNAGSGWSYPTGVTGLPSAPWDETGSIVNVSPRLYPLERALANWIGLAYYDPITHEQWFMDVYVNGNVNTAIVNPFIQSGHSDNFTILSFDITQLDYDKQYTDRRNYGIVFSGYANSENKSLDADLFYMPFYINNSASGLYNFSRPTRLFRSALGQFNPSIIQERATGNLLVTFEQSTLRPYGGLFAAWSNDNGNTWQGPFDMSHPLGLDIPDLYTAYTSKSGETYRVGTTLGNYFLDYFEPFRPVLAPGRDGGFVMVYSLSFNFDGLSAYGICKTTTYAYSTMSSVVAPSQCSSDFNTIVTAWQPWSNFTWYKLGSVQDIAVGDSDRDGRHEILAATGNVATLFEFSKNTASYQLHTQKWTSKEYTRDITSVEISDSNGNGFPELLIESDRGVVNSYEVIDTTMGKADTLVPSIEQEISGLNYSPVVDILTEDINSDGIDDIILSYGDGMLIAYDGSDYSMIFNTPMSDANLEQVAFYRLYMLYSPTTGAPEFILHALLSNVSLIDTNGNIYTSYKFGGVSYAPTITSVLAADIIPGGYDEIIVGLDNGTVVAFDYQFNILWTLDFSSGATYPTIGDIAAGNFTGAEHMQLMVAGLNGTLGLIDGTTGGVIRNQTIGFSMGSYYAIYEDTPWQGMGIVDMDNDGYPDVIIGTSTVYAISGYDGSVIWNTTLYDPSIYGTGLTGAGNGLISQDYIFNDINNDGFMDVITGTLTAYNTKPIPQYIAISGLDGSLIWDLQRQTDEMYVYSRSNAEMNLQLSKNYTLAVGAMMYGSETSNPINTAYFLDEYSGVVIAGIGKTITAFSVAVSNLGYDYPVAIIGDYYGGITIVSLWEGGSLPTYTPTPEGKEEPFIRVGSDFTKRTEFFLEDMLKKNEAGSDGYDDIIAVDDGYIGIADTYQLENDPEFNTAYWQIYDPSYGEYLGGARIADLDGDGSKEIIVPFSNELIVANLQHKEILSSWDYNGLHSDTFSYDLMDVDQDGSMDIVYSVSGMFLLLYYTEFGTLSYKLDQISSTQIYGTYNGMIRPIDIDGDGTKDHVITYAPSSFNSLAANITVFDPRDYTMYQSATMFISGLPQLSDLRVADFDNLHSGDEMILFFDYSKLNLPGFMFSLKDIPTLLLSLIVNTTSGRFGITQDNILGVAPVPGWANDAWTTIVDGNPLDIDGDGQTDMLVENQYGDLYLLDMSGTGKEINIPGSFENIAVPYARNHILIGDFCGENSFVMVSSANTATCYDSLDFTTQPNPQWTVSLDVAIIQDIVAGNLDDDIDGLKNDLIIVSKSGYVWIVNDASFKSFSLSGDDIIQTSQQNISTETITKLIIVGSIFGAFFIGTGIYYRKRKVIKL